MKIDGLASGLKTAEIIGALMEVAELPRTLLSAKSDDKKSVISQLQSLNTKLQDLFTAAKAAAKPGALAQMAVKSSDAAVALSADVGAAHVSTRVVVDRTATTHTVVSAVSTGFATSPLVLTLESADGALVQITPASGSLADVAKALNSAGAGITASVVTVGADANGTPLARLQITSDESGAAGAFRVYEGSPAAVQAGTAVDLASRPGAAIVVQGEDAAIRLWAGTAAEQTVTSSTNTFADLFPGVDVTVSKASAEPVSVSVEADAKARTAAAGDFVTRIASILKGIANGSKATAATAVGETTTLGVFTGDSTVRALNTALANAVQHPIDDISPSTIGISIDRYGVLAFDGEKFADALAKDPAAVEAVFAGVATRVQDVAARYSDKYDGLLTARITGQESEVRTIAEQLESWDRRLDQRRLTLERTYSSLETMLARFQAQSSYLTTQLASLPTYDSGK